MNKMRPLLLIGVISFTTSAMAAPSPGPDLHEPIDVLGHFQDVPPTGMTFLGSVGPVFNEMDMRVQRRICPTLIIYAVSTDKKKSFGTWKVSRGDNALKYATRPGKQEDVAFYARRIGQVPDDLYSECQAGVEFLVSSRNAEYADLVNDRERADIANAVRIQRKERKRDELRRAGKLPEQLERARKVEAKQLSSFDEKLVAVGTPVAGRPPHRSQRAELPHWAPASGVDAQALAGIGVQDTRRGQPSISIAIHSIPVDVGLMRTAR